MAPQINTFDYIFGRQAVTSSGSHQGHKGYKIVKRYINGRYSEWSGVWPSAACISGPLTADRDVMATLAYTTGCEGEASSFDLSFVNGGINGTGATGAHRYTVTLNDNQRQQVNSWLKNSTTGFFTTTIVNSQLPSYDNCDNMIVFNQSASTTTKIFIGLRGFYKNAKYTAQQSYNMCLQYGRTDLPARYMYLNATYCPYAKPNGNAYLYDYNTNLYTVAYKYTSSLTYNYMNNMLNLCSANKIPENYTSNNTFTSYPQRATTTYRVIQYDANSGSAVIENAISPYYTSGIHVQNSSYGMQTPIIICCNETYYTTKIINLVTDKCVITKHLYNYIFDPNLIPVVGNSGLTFQNGNVYGYGHVFYSVNYPYCIWLSDSSKSQRLLVSRVGNQVRVSFGNYETVFQYVNNITIAILSNDPNGICYYTISQITQGFDKQITIYPFNPTVPLANTSAVHTALTQALKTQTDQRWTINTSTATVSGVFSVSISNSSWCVTLTDISVNYLEYTYDSINISVDIVPLNQINNEYVVKTGISTSEFVDNISTTISIPWQTNGVNLLLPCSARTYSMGTYVGVEALSVNQNTFGLALQYLEKDTAAPPEIGPVFDPFIEHYFGTGDTITESENNDENS